VLPPEAPNQEWQGLPRGDTNYVKQLVAATVAKVETEALCDLFEDALDIALVDMQEQMAPKAKRLSRRFAEQSEAEKALIAQAHEARLLAWEKQAMAEVSQSMAAAGVGKRQLALDLKSGIKKRRAFSPSQTLSAPQPLSTGAPPFPSTPPCFPLPIAVPVFGAAMAGKRSDVNIRAIDYDQPTKVTRLDKFSKLLQLRDLRTLVNKVCNVCVWSVQITWALTLRPSGLTLSSFPALLPPPPQPPDEGGHSARRVPRPAPQRGPKRRARD
jgi:hypothetical protein